MSRHEWWDHNFQIKGKSYKSRKNNTLYFWVRVGNSQFRQSTTFESPKERDLLKKIVAVREREFEFSPEAAERMVALIEEIAYWSKGHKYHHDHVRNVDAIDSLLVNVDRELAKLAL